MKNILVFLVIALLITSCSVLNASASYSTVAPTAPPTSTPLPPTPTPAIESCYVDVNNTTIQFSVTGVDIREVCNIILNWAPEYQTLSTVESTEPTVCEFEIGTGVMFSVKSSSQFESNANSFCEDMKSLAVEPTSTPN